MTAPHPPADDAPTIAWAVWLGANTAQRLADEWGITRASASGHLQRAAELNILSRRGRGRYQLFNRGRFGVSNGPVARMRAMLRDPCQRFTTRKTA